MATNASSEAMTRLARARHRVHVGCGGD